MQDWHSQMVLDILDSEEKTQWKNTTQISLPLYVCRVRPSRNVQYPNFCLTMVFVWAPASVGSEHLRQPHKKCHPSNNCRTLQSNIKLASNRSILKCDEKHKMCKTVLGLIKLSEFLIKLSKFLIKLSDVFDKILWHFYRTQVNLGSDLWVRMSVCPYTFCILNWCDSGWWGYQLNTNW